MRPTRRAVLLAAALLATAAPPARAGAADPYDALRRRWLDIALGTGYDPTAEPYASRLAETGELARAAQAAMAPTPTSLWPGYPYDPPFGITQSYGRLWTMAQAHLQQGTGSTGDPALLADVLRGLDHLAATIYNPSTTRYGNWWEWQIGSPRLLMDITAALYDDLTEAQRAAACAAVDHFIPDPMLTDYSGTSTGANRVDLCRSVALRGILGRADAKIALARDALSPVFPYPTDATYLYVLMPGATRRTCRGPSRRPPLAVAPRQRRRPPGRPCPLPGPDRGKLLAGRHRRPAHRLRAGRRPRPPPGRHRYPLRERTPSYGRTGRDHLGAPGARGAGGGRDGRSPFHRPPGDAPDHPRRVMCDAPMCRGSRLTALCGPYNADGL
jgi:hypothetical protein